jgi:hypothetical protein
MTKRALLALLEHGPVAVQPICGLTLYRVAPHDDRDPNGGVWIALASIRGTLVVQDYVQVHAHLDGHDVPLTPRETERVAALLRRRFAQGTLPTRTLLDARKRHRDRRAATP